MAGQSGQSGGEPGAGDGEPTPPSTPFPVVGIGASAGGLEALEALTGRLTSSGMAFVVVQHLAPRQESVLADILARGTAMKVVTIQDGVRVEPNTIYVTPPGADVALEQSVLRLSPVSEQVPRHTIDAFLRSLAQHVGPMGIGIILSGAGSDGTLGLRALAEVGGITFVQDPATATQPSMPQSVLDTGSADFCLSPTEIGDELMRLSAHPFVAKKRPQQRIDAATLDRLFDQLRRAYGVDFSHYKLGTIERRIERRMALRHIEKADEYLHLVQSSDDELGLLYSDLLIGVTAFFRDHEPFDMLKSVVFPRLLEHRRDAPVRIWVPGCATGEEAYSLAMCLLEYLEETRATGIKIQVFATDLDDEALARARLGVYPSNIELDVSPERIQRFFSRQDKGYQISRQLRDMVVFARHNLGKDPPFSRLDLVSCRNVLIYMQPQLQRRVLRVFHYGLNPDGFLVLGASESVGEASDLFSLVDRRLKIYARKNVASASVFDFAMGAKVESPAPASTSLTHTLERRPLVSVQQLADRKVLEKFGPPGLLIDDGLDVIQFRGRTGPYLQPSPGAATLNALKLVRPELLLELRATLRQVADEGLPRTSAPVLLWDARASASVVLEVLPIHEPGAKRRCFLVLFRESPAPAGDEQASQAPLAEPQPRESHEQTLERELLITKEHLMTTVQEIEATNEELQSSNEELQSANEELQSSNEELETSKEELQSTNEELATVNEELHNRMTQLGVSNDDLQNLLAELSLPFIIVGMDLRLRRFSAQAEKLLNLIPTDVGRPVAYLATALDAPQLAALVAEVIHTARERVQRVRGHDGRLYAARVAPYRSADHAIRGALLELLQVPPPRKPVEPVEVNELVGKVLSMLPHVLMLLDELLRIVWVNKKFFDTFEVGAEVIGRSLEDVWPARATHPQLWDELEKAVAGGHAIDGLVVEAPFGRADDRPMRFSTRGLAAEVERAALTLVVMEEGKAQ